MKALFSNDQEIFEQFRELRPVADAIKRIPQEKRADFIRDESLPLFFRTMALLMLEAGQQADDLFMEVSKGIQ